MNIERDAVLRIVRATRMAMRLAENMQKLTLGNERTVADDIAGNLQDVMFDLFGEEVTVESSFNDSTVMRLLTGDLPDGAVADWILMMDSIRTKLDKKETVEQPKPTVFRADDAERFTCGYSYTGAEKK